MPSAKPISTLTKRELEQRHSLSRQMRGIWLLTWHEDKEITPGVPDLSYVMLSPGHETGWLELKVSKSTEKVAIQIEPSQHQWIGFHKKRIPIHFLVEVGDLWYLVPGPFHKELTELKEIHELEELSAVFPKDKMAENSFLFSNVTRRMRNGI